ncbi:apolipoprotein N-acyltransferase [Deinococcus metalli]|uniref:Apolipoprotein N-acyltransferase n=1 Tax=Deinococcus metalli TaxID=1141878 RepID=A0ABQ3JVC3_9DEIO|nr:apolipoprotein N-acyltransferase [Deinococcus metalli]
MRSWWSVRGRGARTRIGPGRRALGCLHSPLRWVLAGIGLAFTFPPSPLGWLAPVWLALLFRAAATATPRQAMRLTWLFAVGLFGALLSWLPLSLAGTVGPAIVALYPLLVGLLAAMWALTAWLTRRLAGRLSLGAFPMAWAALEVARSWGPFGFTWGSLGYTLAQTPLVQVAELGGISLLGLLVGIAASALASRNRWMCGAALLLWGAALVFGVTRPGSPAGTQTALLVQGNVDPREKLAGQADADWQRYLRLTWRGLQRGAADLVLWPETAVTWATRPAALAQVPVPVLLGAAVTQAGQPFNSALLSLRGVVAGRYDKIRLVPFGEFFPGRRALNRVYQQVFSALGLPDLQGLTPGRAALTVGTGALRVGVLICYESTFPALARALVRDGANVLVTPSNDAWFGASQGAEQHFQMGRVRAIETRRWWLRVGNDGISAAVSPSGAVTVRAARFTAQAVPVTFTLQSGQTLAVRWGDAVPAGVALGWLLGTVVLRRRPGGEGGPSAGEGIE